MRKYVLDENMQDKKLSGKNIINAKDLYLECGVIDPKGVRDEYLLMMASNHGYTIITKDKGLVLLAVKKKKEIVWSVGERLILVRGDEHDVFHVDTTQESIDIANLRGMEIVEEASKRMMMQ